MFPIYIQIGIAKVLKSIFGAKAITGRKVIHSAFEVIIALFGRPSPCGSS